MHIARIYEIIILKLRFVFKFFIENFIILSGKTTEFESSLDLKNF